MTIPLVDLAAQHLEVADEVGIGIADVLDRAAFVGGREVGEFEREYAAYVGADHCVGAGNGTDALELALRAVGVTPGARSSCRPTPSSRRPRRCHASGPGPCWSTWTTSTS